MLVSSGVLPARNEHLERLAPWLDQRAQDLHDLTQADLDRWLTDGTTTRRAARYFLHWAHGRASARPMTEEASAAGNLPTQPAKHANRR